MTGPNGLPQIKSTGRNLLVIALVTVCCGVFTASVHGEIHTWRDLLQAVYDGLLYRVVAAFGWLGMKSPLAKYVHDLFEQETVTTSVTPAGAVTIEKTKTTAQAEQKP